MPDPTNTEVTPPAVTPPAGDSAPKVDPASPPATDAPGVGGAAPDLETLRKAAEEYEKAKPQLQSYAEFEKVLESDKEIADAIASAIQGIADKRKGGGAAPAKPADQQVVTPPAGGGTGDQVTAVELRNEIRFGNYVNEFVAVAKAAGVTEELAQEAFDGTVAEILKLNKDPLSNFDISVVKKGFDAWNARVDKLVKAKNDAYAKTKQSDDVPAQGGGAAPKPAQKELTSPEDRRAFIEQGLRAANSLH